MVLISFWSRPARRQERGRRANLVEVEVVEIVTERGGTIALMSFGGTRASRREKVLGGSEEHELGDGEHKWCCDGVGDEGGFWGFCGLVSLVLLGTWK